MMKNPVTLLGVCIKVMNVPLANNFEEQLARFEQECDKTVDTYKVLFGRNNNGDVKQEYDIISELITASELPLEVWFHSGTLYLLTTQEREQIGWLKG